MAGIADPAESPGRRKRWPSAARTPTPGARQDSAEARKLYPVNVEETTTAGVRTDIITPLDMPARTANACSSISTAADSIPTRAR